MVRLLLPKLKLMSILMIVKPVKRLTKQQKEYQRQEAIRHDAMIKKHQMRLNEKIMESRRLSEQQQRQKMKIKMMEEKSKRQKKFFNTVLDNATKQEDRMQFQQMKDIPAEEFIDLCTKMEKMSIQYKRENMRNRRRETSMDIEKGKKTIRRQHTASLNKKRDSSSTNLQQKQTINIQNLKEVQTKISKLIPKLTQNNTMSQSVLAKLFKIKLAQLHTIQKNQQRIFEEDEFEEQQKLFQLINRRKEAKHCFISLSIWQLVNKIIKYTIEQMKACGNRLREQYERIEALFQEKKLSVKEYQKKSFNIFQSSSEMQNIFLSLKAQSFAISYQNLILVGRIWEDHSASGQQGRQLQHLSKRMESFLQIFRNIASQINLQLGKIRLQFNTQTQELLLFASKWLVQFRTLLVEARMENVHAVSELGDGFTRFLLSVNSHLSLFDYLVRTAISLILTPNVFQSPPAVLFPQSLKISIGGKKVPTNDL